MINYDVPMDCESYVHRIGRTARAGKEGKAVMLACERYVEGLSAVEKFIHAKIPVSWAEDDLFVEDKSAGMRIDAGKNVRRGDSARKPGGSHIKSGGERRKGGSGKSGSRCRSKSQAAKDRPAKSAKPDSREARLEYYAQKYGDDFKGGRSD